MSKDSGYTTCPNVEGGHSGQSTLIMKIRDFFNCMPDKSKKKPKQNRQEMCLFFKRGLCIFGLICVFLTSLAGCCVMWFTDIYVEEIINQMTIREGSDVYEAWRKPPVKPLICVHIFNYTNLPRFSQGLDEKIKLEEVGPYCYRETLEKKNITFNNDGTVTYGDTRKHEFEPSYSKGFQNDTVIVPNLSFISTVAMSRHLSPYLQVGISFTLRNIIRFTNSTISVTAHDFLFGYNDRIVKYGSEIARLLQQDVPFDKFGILAQRAAITEETTTVRTGTNDVDRIGVVTEINGQTSLDAWPEEECNKIDGSDGAFFPRRTLNESATIYLFHKDMCRKMPFVYEKEVEFQDGVVAMRFHAAPDVYNTNGTCYCPESGCAPDGVFDLSPCAMGAPIMMSFPHFLYGDPSLSEPFEGLHPDPEKHEFYIDIQRLLGFTLGTVSRLQLNIQIHQSTWMPEIKGFPNEIILPVVWLQVSAEKMPPELFNIIYHATFTVKRMQYALMWGTLFATLISAVFLFYYIKKVQRETKRDVEVLPVNETVILTTNLNNKV
ncbi:scavenger receptor class B member 1-like isoform X2 [Cimex lectularius]|uniref:Scavenger receptor class B member 1 n=1 Tax=Cimex lectularius TaxID=79782 RepID=A0A8I6RGA3_CIMLE|nr:scavenger receptor class B member 1-like isoform X2 [Cimex lectularius]